jgi:hypothetical protein
VEKSSSLVYTPDRSDYRKIAQENWGLSDLQMEGMHVHHHPPRSSGGRNIPEHLYVCSPDVHQYVWHRGYAFPKMASEGGKLSAIVRRKQAEERKKLPEEEQKKQREERRVKREEKRKRRERREELRLKKLTKAALAKSWGRLTTTDGAEYQALKNTLVEEGLLLPD